MFHVKRKLPFLLAASVFAVLLASGCVHAAAPRGWAPPVEMQSNCVGTSSTPCLLISAHDGKLDAIDPVSGDRKWRFPDDWTIADKNAQKLQGIYSRPQISGDIVYLADYNGYIYAFKPSEATQDDNNRKPAGVYKVEGRVVGGIQLEPGTNTLYVTTDAGLLYALNVNAINTDQANVFLPFAAGERIWTAPVVADGRVYFGTTDGRLFAVDAKTGAQVWEPFKADAALVSTPVVSGNTVLIGGFDRRLYAIDTATGKQKWSFEATDWIWAKPLVDSGSVYFGDFKGKVFAVSLADGKPVWDAPFDAVTIVRSSPTMSGGALVVANNDGNVFGVDPASGRPSWGPVTVGNSVQADLTANGSTVFVAPTGCVSVEAVGKIYYFRVNANTQERQSTGSVC